MKYLYITLLIGSFLKADNMGSLLFHGNCITCHSETKSISAPSILKIKEHYFKAFSDRDMFIEYMSQWVLLPKKESSIMLHAVDKYSLMPELAFDIETLKSIAAYIYDTDFKKEHSGHKE